MPVVLEIAQKNYKTIILETTGRFDSQEEYRSSVEEKLKKSNIDIKKIYVPRHTLFPSILSFSFKSYRLLRTAICRNESTIIYARNYKFTPFLLLVHYLWNIPFVYSPRSAIVSERKFYRKTKDIFYAFLIASLEKKAIKKSAATILETDGFRRHLQNLYKIPSSNLRVIPNYYNDFLLPSDTWDREEMRKKLGFSEKKVIVYAGTAEVWYDFARMFELVSILKKRDSKIFFQLYLKEDYARDESRGILEDIRKLAKKFELREKIDYAISSYPPSERYFYLSACDAGICLTTTAEFKTIMFYLKLTDYLASGLPLIVNNEVTEAKKIIEKSHCGSLVDYNHWKESVENIDPNRLFAVNNNYKKQVGKYSSSCIVPQYLALFESIGK